MGLFAGNDAGRRSRPVPFRSGADLVLSAMHVSCIDRIELSGLRRVTRHTQVAAWQCNRCAALECACGVAGSDFALAGNARCVANQSRRAPGRFTRADTTALDAVGRNDCVWFGAQLARGTVRLAVAVKQLVANTAAT